MLASGEILCVQRENVGVRFGNVEFVEILFDKGAGPFRPVDERDERGPAGKSFNAIAPVPAHRSRNRVSSLICGARTLKRVSRSRSDVGRVLLSAGLLSTRPR